MTFKYNMAYFFNNSFLYKSFILIVAEIICQKKVDFFINLCKFKTLTLKRLKI